MRSCIAFDRKNIVSRHLAKDWVKKKVIHTKQKCELLYTLNKYYLQKTKQIIWFYLKKIKLLPKKRNVKKHYASCHKFLGFSIVFKLNITLQIFV